MGKGTKVQQMTPKVIPEYDYEAAMRNTLTGSAYEKLPYANMYYGAANNILGGPQNLQLLNHQALQRQEQLYNGQVGDAFTKAYEDAIRSPLEHTLGTSVMQLAQRGVLSGSPQDQMMKQISDSAAQSASENYFKSLDYQMSHVNDPYNTTMQNATTAWNMGSQNEQQAQNLYNAWLSTRMQHQGDTVATQGSNPLGAITSLVGMGMMRK